jgi:hypothetical protein
MTPRTFTVYNWDTDNQHKIRVIYKDGCYTVKLDGQHWSERETIELVEAEITLMLAMYGWHWIPRV